MAVAQVVLGTLTLIQHINSPAESTPGSAVGTVHMTHGMNIRSPLVDCGMDNKPSRVDRPQFACDLRYARDPIALFVDPHHIGDRE